jgi:phospholipid/cholesterol/gamma-HCH transport system substrate-binding protein
MADLEIKPTAALRWRVASVILAAMSITGFLVFLLTSGGGDLLAPKATLITFMPDSEGLAINSPVRLSGIKIGVVRGVDLSAYRDPQRAVRVEMRVRSSYLSDIPSDSLTAISADTLIGDKVLAIDEGKSSSPVADGGVLPSEPLKQAADKADLIRAIGNDLRAVNDVMINLSDPTSPLGSVILGEAEYRRAMEKLTAFNESVHAFVGPDSAAGQMFFSGDLYDRVHRPLVELDKQLDAIEASKLISSASQYDDLVTQTRQLRAALADVHLDRDSPAYARLQQLLKQADTALSTLNFGREQTYEELNGRLRELQALLRDIREEPRKYLRYKVF